MSKAAVVTTATTFKPAAPPAIWAAFARQGEWKNWVMAAQLCVVVLLIFVNLELATRAPDVVLVTPDGKSIYVERSIVGDSILETIRAARGQPTDANVSRFAKEFVRLAFAINSSTIDESWPQALALMAPPLRAKLEKEYASQRVLETWKLARLRTQLTFDELVLVERTDRLLHVRARAIRQRSSLLDESAGASRDHIQVDVVLGVISRSESAPDGLEVVDFSFKEASATADGKNSIGEGNDP